MKNAEPHSRKWLQIKRIWFTWALLRGAFLVAGCGAGFTQKTEPPVQPPAAGVSVSVSPTTANIRAGDSYTFKASVSGSSNTSVTWSVNGMKGGSATVGTIDANGK